MVVDSPESPSRSTELFPVDFRDVSAAGILTLCGSRLTLKSRELAEMTANRYRVKQEERREAGEIQGRPAGSANDPNSRRSLANNRKKAAEIDADAIPVNECLSFRLAGKGFGFAATFSATVFEGKIDNFLEWLTELGFKPTRYAGSMETYEGGLHGKAAHGYHQHFIMHFEGRRPEELETLKKYIAAYWTHGIKGSLSHAVHFSTLATPDDLRWGMNYLCLPLAKPLPKEIKGRFRWSRAKWPKAPEVSIPVPAALMPAAMAEMQAMTKRKKPMPHLGTQAAIVTDPMAARSPFLIHILDQPEAPSKHRWLAWLSEQPSAGIRQVDGVQSMRTTLLDRRIFHRVPKNIAERLNMEPPKVETVDHPIFPHKKFSPGFMEITAQSETPFQRKQREAIEQVQKVEEAARKKEQNHREQTAALVAYVRSRANTPSRQGSQCDRAAA